MVKQAEITDLQMNDLERYSYQEQSAKYVMTYCFIPWIILALFYRTALYVGLGTSAFKD